MLRATQACLLAARRHGDANRPAPRAKPAPSNWIAHHSEPLRDSRRIQRLKRTGAKNKTNPFSPEARERAWYANRPVCEADKVWEQMNRDGIRAARRTVVLTSAHQANVKVAP
ncbi:hypothetical protein AB6Q13_21755 [Ralstonia solanacearum]|uniref:hypothetical protein n=1 Tax=Ralstonia solanacearum TaxID=305 RepID=UPI00168A5E8A|nr:hypothetical protein [Ralstonia solanacearum]MDB0569126.1 hypothetical protein [Ralstonia solanacearum]MDB0578860.1 hypothetical protein [Ralstonia solanacearum]QNT25480.1 hypothetical protein C2I38_25835 [Ralstonia solanacearum]QNT25918.1 hypothetical protein C2I38_027875 [Ralstonia solanacearum]QNT63125.1 hypothetical protein C2L97_25865 [Ralstonia solanacearum]